IFLLYVVAISRLEDIKRVFMYHGAEHKTINCYEAGDELTPQKVAEHSRYHKRCGTSFMFIVMIISIFVFMFITAQQMWMRFVLRMVLIPVVASLSYECIRMAGRHDSAFWNVLSKPGMWVQQLTTKEPTEEMLQVAIVSVEAVLYGKPYVKAVNEAQGIGAPEENTSKESVDVDEPEEEACEDEEQAEVESQPERRTTRKQDKHDSPQAQSDGVEDADLSEFEKSFFED
ncbi:MAG: DUF1385 domain-containing protein, partial [Lachnospiraceae bacterium]|nr:DUF1385 domain-containing protein [Lachnospiraceae bacterium]